MNLVELMHDYLNQYGYMESFLDYCVEQEDLDREKVEVAIDNAVYGY